MRRSISSESLRHVVMVPLYPGQAFAPPNRAQTGEMSNPDHVADERRWSGKKVRFSHQASHRGSPHGGMIVAPSPQQPGANGHPRMCSATFPRPKRSPRQYLRNQELSRARAFNIPRRPQSGFELLLDEAYPGRHIAVQRRRNMLRRCSAQ